VSSRGVEIHDLDSKNGTFVADRRLAAPAVAGDGVAVRFGSVPFTLRAAGSSTETATVP
jgi:hypothetical protein